MKVKDLPEDTIITNVLVKIPHNIKIPDYGTAPRREVYIRGFTFGNLFVSLTLKAKRIYPIVSYAPNPLEWEVIDPKYKKIAAQNKKLKKLVNKSKS